MEFESAFSHPKLNEHTNDSIWLVVGLSPSTLTYVLTNRQQEVLSTKRYRNYGLTEEEFLMEVHQAEAELRREYAVSQLISYSPRWNLEESRQVRRGDEPKFLEAIYPDLDEGSHRYYSDAVAPFPIRSLFAVDRNTVNKAEDLFANLSVKHHLTMLVRQAFRVYKTQEAAQLGLACVYDDHVSIVLFKSGELLLANSYPANGAEAALQALQLAVELSGAAVDALNLALVGPAVYYDALHAQLKPRFPQLLETAALFPNDPDMSAGGVSYAQLADLIVPN